MLVRNHQDVHFEASLDLDDFSTFFIQEEGSHFDWYLCMNRCCVFLHRFFLDDAQNLQCRRFSIANVASAVTTWAGDMATFR